MDGCEDYRALICRLYDMPFGLLHAWATPDNRACLEMLVDWCELDKDYLDKLGAVIAVLDIEPSNGGNGSARAIIRPRAGKRCSPSRSWS